MSPLLLIVAFLLAPSTPAQRCQKLMEEFRSSVIFLQVQKTNEKTGEVTISRGTAFLISDRGFALTNYHLIRRDPNISEILVTGALASQFAQPQPMMALGEDQDYDIALLQFKGTNQVKGTNQGWSYLPIGDPGREVLGSDFCSFGFPSDIDLVPTVGILQRTDGQLHQWWLSTITTANGESGAPVFDADTGTVVALKVADRDDVRSSYVVPLNLASRLYRDKTGLDLIGPNAVTLLTKEAAHRILGNYLSAVKERNAEAWRRTLSSYDSDAKLKRQDNPEIIWPKVIAELNSSYKEAFDWALGFGPHWRISTEDFSLYAGPTNYEVLDIVTKDNDTYADVKLSYPKNALRDWNNTRSIKSLIARIGFQNGKLKSNLRLSVPATTHTGSQYSNIVDQNTRIFDKSIEYYRP